MRVLTVGNMYPPHHLGGYELVWRSSTLALRAAGHEVRVLTTDYRAPERSPDAELDAEVYRDLRWYWRDGRFPDMTRSATVRLERHNRRALKRHLTAFRPDVVSWWAMGGMALSMIEQARRARLPAVGFPHDDWMLYGLEVDRWLRGCAARPRAAALVGRLIGVPTAMDLQRAGDWIFNSAFTRRQAVDRGLIPAAATGIASPGIDPAMFAPAARPAWRWHLLYVGRLDPRKGIDTAIDCLGMLPREAELTIVGSGDEEYQQRLHARISEEGLAGRVRIVASCPRDELASRYAAADVLVFPVIWDEPWGLVPLEAMSVGTPVVATGTGGSREYLDDRGNALLFAPGDPSALAGAIRELAESADLRRRLSAAGAQTARMHSEEGFNRRIEAELERATSRSST